MKLSHLPGRALALALFAPLAILWHDAPAVRAAPQMSSPSGGVQVRVKSAERQESVAGAEVTLLPSGRMESNLNGYTDGSGRVAFAGVRSGPYEIVVEMDGYQTTRERVIINPGSRETFLIQIRRLAVSGNSSSHASTISARRADVPEVARKAYDEGLASLKDDPARSVEQFERAVKEFPKFAEAYMMRGLAEHRLGKKAEAVASLSKAIEIDSKLAPAHLLLGKVHLEEKAPAEAEKPLRQSINLDPNSWEAHFQLARCLYNTNRLDEALRHARRALELPEFSPLTHLLLADIHTSRNEKKEALRELEKFAKADPQSPLLPRVRQMIDRLRAGAEN